MKPAEKPLYIRNASGNNLKNLSLELPHDTFTAVTGVSGSGKSTLAFETIYAEGQRRYIETFSPYTRQFFDKVKKPQVDLIENVRPAIAIQQRTRVTNSRSTVGSMSDIDDYLKVLWTNIAAPVCPSCGISLHGWPVKKLALYLYKKSAVRSVKAIIIAAPMVSGPHNELVPRLAKLGLSRALDARSGQLVDLDGVQTAPVDQAGRVLVLIDRLPGGSIDKKRTADSIEQSYLLSNGSCTIGWIYADPKRTTRPFVTVQNTDQQENIRHGLAVLEEFTAAPSCPTGIQIPTPKRALFSYNHPLGACPTCKGFGHVLDIDPRRCVPDPRKSIAEDAIQCWSGPAAKRERRKLLEFCRGRGIDLELPWSELPAGQQNLLLTHKSREFRGVIPWFKKIERKIYKMHVRVFLSRYRTQKICPQCRGMRLTKEALAFQVKGNNLADLWAMSVGELYLWIADLKEDFSAASRDIRDTITAILSRLSFLNDLGLAYLTLNRQARTLSGGETQRVNLATALGSELVSTHFVLDEPSVGLHPRDTERLISSLQKLHKRGNSLLVVEHDPDCIAAAERVLELGPGPGKQGGNIVYHGEIRNWRTGLEPHENLWRSSKVLLGEHSSFLDIRSVSARNLRNFTVRLPLGAFVCLAGVSGSGKSTLINEVIKKAAEERDLGLVPQDGPAGVFGFEQLKQVLLVDQSPLAKSPRANVATYTGMWSLIRAKLADTEPAQERSLGKGAFSFNVDGGRCPACKGAGFVREDMQFLSDIYIPCELCLGKRFQPTVLDISYRGKNVLDFLDMTAEEAASFFHNDNCVRDPAEILCELGLGHLALGHPLSELSGGESQRLKLVPFLSQAQKGSSLLMFDEPTTGLHTRDVEKLISLLRKLRDKGHSVLCVEHNLLLILSADWIVDLGPEGGALGGRLVMEGPPDSFLAKESALISHTAVHLQRYYANLNGKRKKSTHGKKPKSISKPQAVKIVGAREHNLKNIDLQVPLGKLVALTGVSGSGKSTIAKDIIYAEGQRRYLDCLSPYARQFIKELKKPEIDSIRNIPPTLCVYQHTFQPSHLSTVATMSEIYNFLRLLFAKTATQYCPDHPDKEISARSFDQIAAQIKGLPSNTVRILAPAVKSKKGFHKHVFTRAIASEISEVRVDGRFAAPSRFLEGLERSKAHSIDFTVAKFNPARVPQEMIEDAVAHALALGGGNIIVHGDSSDRIFSTDRTCPVCRKGFFKPDPEDLSFNSRRGACHRCAGRGFTAANTLCRSCGGTRLNEIARNLRIAGANIYELCDRPAGELLTMLPYLRFPMDLTAIAEPVLKELAARLSALSALGLDYIKLNRDCHALSSGELQRLRLAAALGSPLSGVLYILDEPSAGLHPDDNRKVLAHLAMLKQQNNSVIVIEHDCESITACDYIIDVGPGGGTSGGKVVFTGPLRDFRMQADTPTAHALRAKVSIEPPAPQERQAEHLLLTNAVKNNLQGLNLKIPLKQFVVVAGVSGAGKSSLVHGTIADLINSGRGSERSWRQNPTKLESTVDISRSLLVDQAPIGKNARSTPASFLGVWNQIRELYASTPGARARGLSAGYFSYNTGKGRCPECLGRGELKLEMSFLADASIVCEVCGGKRYSEDADSIHYLNFSISEALGLTFEQARTIYINHRKIHRILQCACDLGLGYLTLGQASETLSGGESQRIKLVAELAAARKAHTLYILDEPTTGLHKADVQKLIKTLKALTAAGHSVIVIEHDPDVIVAADHLIELGPGAGDNGGRIIFQGHPHELPGAATPWGRIVQHFLQ